MLVRTLIALAVLAVPAAAASFRDLAATADGGAWVVRTDELWRVAPDGKHESVAVPIAGPLHAVATADGTVWVLGAEALAIRGAGDWRTIALPKASTDYDVYELSPALLTPLGAGRLLVLRACPGSECTEVFVVDGEQVAATAKFDWKVGPAVADGRGGAWAIATRGSDTSEKVAYAHFDGAAWRSWSFHSLAIAGMTDAGGSAAFPDWIVAAGPEGFIGIDNRTLWWIGADGAIVRKDEITSRDSFRNQTLCAMADDRELAVVQGQLTSNFDGSRPTAPLVVRLDRATGAKRGVDEVDTPGWWDREHETSTPRLRCGASGGVRWVVAPDAVFRQDRGGWRTLAAGGASASAPAATQRLWSLPLNFGFGFGGDTTFAYGLRPELVIAPNRSRPSYGFGLYADVSRAGGATFLGGGLTAVAYSGNLGSALSIGAVERFAGGERHPQVVVSAFLGVRGPRVADLPPAETPFGLRFEFRPGTSDLPTSGAIMASLDVLGLVIIGGAFSSLMPRG